MTKFIFDIRAVKLRNPDQRPLWDIRRANGVDLMNKPLTASDYMRRIELVIAYIGEHLDDALDLEALAAVACFSPYHFHRIYRSLMGETAAETLRRLRLQRASGEIIGSTTPLARIAKRAGYGSVAAFTRAFTSVFGVPPAQYRRQGRLLIPAPATHDPETTMYPVTIKTLDPVRLLTLPHTGPYIEIGATFDRLFAWAGGRGLMGPHTRSIGVYYDDPEAVAAAKLRSAAGISVPAGTAAATPAEIVDIPGGRHAMLTHQGPYAELENAYRWLYREWLPQSGEEPANQPIFEEYLNDPRTLPPKEWLTAVCLKLAG
jgi:AraC family transcriptional regulator